MKLETQHHMSNEGELIEVRQVEKGPKWQGIVHISDDLRLYTNYFENDIEALWAAQRASDQYEN